MKPAYIDDQWSEDPKGYSIRSGYEWLRPKHALQSWKNFVWNKWNYPKHAMISWITMNNGLKVKDKLYPIGCCPDNRCCICDTAVETQSHLFFECLYSRQIIAAVETWCGFKVDVSMSALPNGIGPKPALKQDVHSLIWTACLYFIWTQRNNARINLQLIGPDNVAVTIREEVKRKIRARLSKEPTQNDRVWLRK
ncbi:uncharacterized protein LOC141639327 [Silene latifolia]|uniref:uncharacterized protein LOC141639327 n=1 Tax=Silene latifolia TaxID=37657 RepID=UPI003D78878E